ncbi:MAG: glycosyltransferase family 2 protein [Clostridia bacterium]|nr:glycosyltransferase family 2 protein [Clostridia bacterium]
MFSLVIPAFNEEKCLYENINEIVKYVQKYDYEMILIDDGSKDNTWGVIQKLHSENSHIRGIRFSRNFGKEYALCAGVAEVQGDAAIIMDSDLQHPPEYIDAMIEKWSEGYKVVECVKEQRGKETLKNRISANAFYGLLYKFTGYNLKNGCDFKLLDRQVVDEINQLKESQVFFRGLVEWVGFKKCQIFYTMKERQGDTSKFNVKSLSKLALTAITSFSSSLLYLTIFLAILFFVIAIILGIQTLVNKISGNALTGFTTVILLQLIIGACVLGCLGIIGVYISKIYDEVKQRPRYIISEKI